MSTAATATASTAAAATTAVETRNMQQPPPFTFLYIVARDRRRRVVRLAEHPVSVNQFDGLKQAVHDRRGVLAFVHLWNLEHCIPQRVSSLEVGERKVTLRQPAVGDDHQFTSGVA